MRARHTLLCAILAGAALVGLAGTAQAATTPAATATTTAVATTVSGDVQEQAIGGTKTFVLKNWSFRDWRIDKVFATDGSGTNTRVGPFQPQDAHPAAGTVVAPFGAETFTLQSNAFNVHGFGVVLSDPAHPRESMTIWMKDEWFGPYVDAKHPANVLVQGYASTAGTVVGIW
ncbi:hypothetical protein, partial [Pseudonocardia ailaonensis]|uniref:hypothetical protein n=1 Tax=Pseudonocardia ailaonensis TaxID=367279 RepID=UPI0031E02165